MHIGSRKNPFNDYEQLPSPRIAPPRSPADSFLYASGQPRPKKEFGMFSKRYLPQQNTSRSRLTQGGNLSASGWGLGAGIPGMEEQLYSQQMVFLVGEEEGNLRYFKEKVQAEKQRALRDFQHLKQQIQHLIQDLQVSVLAELDLVYKDFLSRYQQFKQHMVSLKDIRRTLMNQLSPESEYLPAQNRNNSQSNRDLLGEIEKDALLFRTQKVYSQIADLQRENVTPARELANQIILLGGIQTQFYDEKVAGELLRSIVEGLGREAKGIYPEIRDKMVLSAQFVVQQAGRGTQDILNGLSEYEPYPPPQEEERISNFRSADHRDIIKSFRDNSSRKPDPKPSLAPQTDRERKYVRPISSSSDMHSVGVLGKQSKAREEDSKRVPVSGRNYHMGSLKQPGSGFRVGVQQQNVFAEWAQDISLREVGTIQAHQSTQAMLCCVFALQGKVLVMGGKDKNLRVYEVSSGKLLYVLSGHQANICSLASHGQLVSSGGDHGCSSLIVWDSSKSWSMRSRVQLHSAAVTCIVDLQDSTTLATGSYDKKLNIFSCRKGTVVLTATCKAGIACMALSSDKHRLISSSLDNSIGVWKLSREGTNITNLELERQFMNDSLVCSLRPFALRSNYFMVGTKDGRIQIINCLTGETLRKLSVATTPVVEILLFQRENKSEVPIVISCAPKEKSLIVTKTETGVNSLIDVKGRLNVEIGCGIGPKVVISQGGLMAILSQSPMARQVLLYQLAVL